MELAERELFGSLVLDVTNLLGQAEVFAFHPLFSRSTLDGSAAHAMAAGLSAWVNSSSSLLRPVMLGCWTSPTSWLREWPATVPQNRSSSRRAIPTSRLDGKEITASTDQLLST